MRNNGIETIGRSAQFLVQCEEFKTAGELADPMLGKSAGDMSESNQISPDALDMQWKAPEPGTVKLNSDASFLAETGKSCAGAVARDSHGRVAIAICKRLAPCCSVEEAEARAALVGLQELAGTFRGQVTIELDCQFIAKELAAQTPTRSPCYGLVMDIKKAMRVSMHATSAASNAVAMRWRMNWPR